MAARLARKSPAAESPVRFDVARLRKIAGDKTFDRGLEYYQDGEVEIISIDTSRVLADVTGSEVYRCELKGTGGNFSGTCSCPAFSDWGFCKHLVATALTANDLGPEAAQQGADRMSTIRDHLRAKGIEQLVDVITKLAVDDPALLRSFELEIGAATSDDKTLVAQLKKEIDKATHTHGYVDYRQASEWTGNVARVLGRIETLLAGGRAKPVLLLLDHFFARMDYMFENIDDSDGHFHGVYEQACEVHLEACLAAKPDPVLLARDLFARETESDWEFFYGASETYAEILGDAGLAEYRRLASEAWKAIKPARAGARHIPDAQAGDRYRFGEILERFAERDGDIDARIAIRRMSLTSAYAYLALAQLCAEHGRKADALKWAEEGLWQFEDNPDQRLVTFAADLYRRSGRQKDADDLLWKAFERSPSMELYRRLKQIAGRDKGAVEVARDRAIGILRAQLPAPTDEQTWFSPTRLLIEVLVSEKLLSDAWAVVRTHGCGNDQLMIVAKASEESHPDEALAAYARHIEQLAGSGGQENYEQCGKTIARMQAIRKHRGENAAHATFVAEFMHRHKAKRNLMKVLQATRG